MVWKTWPDPLPPTGLPTAPELYAVACSGGKACAVLPSVRGATEITAIMLWNQRPPTKEKE